MKNLIDLLMRKQSAMFNPRKLVYIIAGIAFATTSIASAGVLVTESVAPQESFTSPSGHFSLAFAFTLNVTVENVVVSVPVATLRPNTVGTIYLTNALGPGTSESNVISALDMVNLPVLPPNTVGDWPFQTLFSIPAMNAGTYYVTFLAYSQTYVFLPFPGSNIDVNTELGSVGAEGGLFNVAFRGYRPPSDTVGFAPEWPYVPIKDDQYVMQPIFRVESVPEPGTSMMIASGLVLVLVIPQRWRRRISSAFGKQIA